MSSQGYAKVNWDTLETFGLRKGSPKRWKFNSHAPEGHTVNGRMKVKSSNATPIHFPKLTCSVTGNELPQALQPEHNPRKVVKLAESQWANSSEAKKLAKARVSLSAEKREMAKRVLRIAAEQGISNAEAAQMLRQRILDLGAREAQNCTETVIARNAEVILDNR